MTHSFPTRRSSDLIVVNGDPQPDDARALDPGIVEHPAHRTAIEIADMARQREIDLFGNARERLPREIDERSEEHTSELQSLMRISYAVFCLKKKKNTK